MIGWMQNWDTCKNTGYEDRLWFGQMTLPGTCRQGWTAVSAAHPGTGALSSQMVEYRNVPVSDCITLPGVEGRCVELDLRIRPENAGTPYHKFTMRFAQDDQYYSILSYRPHESLLKIDRKFSGSRRAYIHQRRCQVASNNGEIHLHVILDRFSIEVFVNDGEQVMTATILTDPSAQRISFEADGRAVMDITKYSLFSEE